jgi:GT2 family glycosyltransferase
VSIIIVNWNGKHLLEECLSSIEIQVFLDFEILVVDNGSTDGSKEYLREKFPHIRLIELNENQGFAGPNNLAFKKASGQFVATINNDLTLDPSWLDLLLRKLESETTCFAVQGKILKADQPETIDTCGLGIRPCGAARNLAHNKNQDGFLLQTRPVFSVSAGAALYRKSMLKELSYFDSTYFAYYEDLDLGWRARLKGWHSLLVPEATAYHKVHGTSAMVPGDFLWFLSERNRLRTLVKNLPAGALARHPFRILMDELRYVDMIRKKTNWHTLLRSRWAVLKELVPLIRKRMPELKKLGSKDWEEWLAMSQE